ncbi:MAG: hypothetical protein ABSE89_05345 [Sedimentisphaerales bacterium]
MKNKIFLTIFIAAIVIAASIWSLSRPPVSAPRVFDENQTSPQSMRPPQTVQPALIRISYTQAPDYVGKYVCVTGVVDHVDTSVANNIFLYFCTDSKKCPFGAVIFKLNAPKFLDPSLFIGKTVEITGTITYYQRLIKIILTDPAQIKIIQ